MTSSQTLSLSGVSSELECYFFPPIEVGGRAEMGVLSLQTYNSVPNIGPGCNTIGVICGNSETVWIKIPTGCYELIALEAKIQELLEAHVTFFVLTADNNTLKCLLYCSNDIDLNTENSIAPLLGFDKRVLKGRTKHESNSLVKIMNINSIKVECNLALGSFENGEQSHTIHEFYPTVPPGYKIVEIPRYCILYKLKTNSIDHVRVSLKDQNNRLINFQGETINVRLLIKNGPEI